MIAVVANTAPINIARIRAQRGRANLWARAGKIAIQSRRVATEAKAVATRLNNVLAAMKAKQTPAHHRQRSNSKRNFRAVSEADGRH
jgi:hypothetical protein